MKSQQKGGVVRRALAPALATRSASHVAVLGAALLAAPIPSMVAEHHNYTWSLLIFVVPIVLILYWFFLTPEQELAPSRRAFLATLGLLVPMGILLNLLFADEFFLYPNQDAVLGWYVPALDFFSIDRAHPIPLEEFAFYISGFIAMLLFYVWGDTVFFSRYQPRREAPPRPLSLQALVQLLWSPLWVCLLVVAVAWIGKNLWGAGGFPGYLCYLVLIPAVVTGALFKVAAPRINWQAYVFMFVVILANSITWEVTLALPNGWWNYQHEAMVGVFVRAWSDLPVEAVLVWVLATIATVVTFESARLYFASRAASPAAARAGEPAAAPPTPAGTATMPPA